MKKALSVILTVLIIFSASGLIASAEGGTSTDYRDSLSFGVSRIFYNSFALVSEQTVAIPGLENTDVYGADCSTMTPQGLCVSEDYIFISAYCAIEKYKKELEQYALFGENKEKLASEQSHEKHNSVIYIIDRKTGEYIKNMVLPDTNHVGGLAFDGENLLIAKSSDKQLSIITGKQIERVLQTKSMSVRVDYAASLDCDCNASFVVYFADVIWVGVFNEKQEGELNGFRADKLGGALVPVASVPIPEKANGACFTELDGEICLAINSSYGRKALSDVYLYSVENYASQDMSLVLRDSFKAPPTIQNSCIYEGKVYTIFESAATCYSEVEAPLGIKSTTCAVDRICIGDETLLFDWHYEGNLLLKRLSDFAEAVKALLELIF